MVWAVRIIGLVIILAGIVFSLKPQTGRKLIELLREGRRMYLVGIVRIALGAVLTLAGPQCNWTPVVMGLGILFMVSGLLIFTLGREKVRRILDWWLERSTPVFQLGLLVAVALGVLIVYSA